MRQRVTSGAYACRMDITGTIRAADGTTREATATGANHDAAVLALRDLVSEGEQLIYVRADGQ